MTNKPLADAAYELGLPELNEACGSLREHLETGFAEKPSTFASGSIETLKSSGGRSTESKLSLIFSHHTKDGKPSVRGGLKLGWLSPSRSTLESLVDPTMRIMEEYVAELEAQEVQLVSAMPSPRHCIPCIGLGVEMESHDITMQRHERLATASKANK